MQKAHRLERILGKVIQFPSTTLPFLVSKKHQILTHIQQNGCICINDVNLNEIQQIQFTKQIWPRVIELPRGWALNNKDQRYNSIVRVGNVLLDNSVKDSSKQAIAWHQDGDFWGENRKKVYSCLQTKIEPDAGGDTHFIDLVQGYSFLRQKKPQVFQQLKNSIGQIDVQKIDDFRNNNAKNTLAIDTVTRHEIIRKDPYTGLQMLYLAGQKIINKNTQKQSNLKFEQIIDYLQKQMGYYGHKWKKGDFVLWDNTQVMHRACGLVVGRRLLFRTQGSFQL